MWLQWSLVGLDSIPALPDCILTPRVLGDSDTIRKYTIAELPVVITGFKKHSLQKKNRGYIYTQTQDLGLGISRKCRIEHVNELVPSTHRDLIYTLRENSERYNEGPLIIGPKEE